MILKNDELTVEINTFGAEMKSVVKNGVEYMWQGDTNYWGRTSPILFPFVGKLTDDEYIFDNIHYNMTQHGFARDNEFVLTSSTSKKATYIFQDNPETLLKYPFNFKLEISYELIDSSVEITWIIANTSKREMFFQIGAHPAFNFLNGSFIDINKTTNHYILGKTPHIETIIKDVDIKSIEIDNDTFLNNALIYDNIENVILRDHQKSVEVHCEGFPYFGIWTNVINGVNAPFICLEPWCGITDFANHDKQLKTKESVIKLGSDEIFKTFYKITFD